MEPRDSTVVAEQHRDLGCGHLLRTEGLPDEPLEPPAPELHAPLTIDNLDHHGAGHRGDGLAASRRSRSLPLFSSGHGHGIQQGST
jgi:hypothetical protein